MFIYSITVTVKERAAEIHPPPKLVSGATMFRFKIYVSSFLQNLYLSVVLKMATQWQK